MRYPTLAELAAAVTEPDPPPPPEPVVVGNKLIHARHHIGRPRKPCDSARVAWRRAYQREWAKRRYWERRLAEEAEARGN